MLFRSIPDQPYIVRVTNLSIIPNINQGIVSYPVKADILTTREIAAALPELARYASGIDLGSSLSGFLPSSPGAQVPNSRPNFDPSNLDIDCLRKSLSEDFEISDISPETIMKIRESGCIEESDAPSLDLSSGGIFNLIQQFSPSSLPVAGMEIGRAHV